jgi:hypothetical protein
LNTIFSIKGGNKSEVGFIIRTFSTIAVYYGHEVEIFNSISGYYKEITEGPVSQQEICDFVLALINSGNPELGHAFLNYSHKSHRWNTYISFPEAENKYRKYSIMKILHKSVVNNPHFTPYMRRRILFSYERHAMRDIIAASCSSQKMLSQIANSIIYDSLLKEQCLIIAPDLTVMPAPKFRYVMEETFMSLTNNFMCRLLSEFNIVQPVHVDYIYQVLNKFNYYIPGHLQSLKKEVFGDTERSLNWVAFLTKISHLPLPKLTSNDVQNFENITPVITQAILLNHSIEIPNYDYSDMALNSIYSILLVLFQRIERFFNSYSEFKQKHGQIDDSVYTQFEQKMNALLQEHFPIAYHTFLERYLIPATKNTQNSQHLNKCLKVLRYYMKFFYNRNVERVVFNILRNSPLSSEVVEQFLNVLSDMTVPFNELLEKKLLERVLLATTLDNSTHRIQSRQIVVKELMKSKLFTSVREVDLWLKVLKESDIPFVEEVIRRSFCRDVNTAKINQLTEALSPIEKVVSSVSYVTGDSSLLISRVMIHALVTLNDQGGAASGNAQFIFTVLALLLSSSEYTGEHGRTVVLKTFKSVSKNASYKNLVVLDWIVELLQRNTEYDDEFGQLIKKSPDETGNYSFILTELYPKIQVPMVQEKKQLLKIVENALMIAPFDFLYHQWRLAEACKSKSSNMFVETFIPAAVANLLHKEDISNAIVQVTDELFSSDTTTYSDSSAFSVQIIFDILKKDYEWNFYLNILRRVYIHEKSLLAYFDLCLNPKLACSIISNCTQIFAREIPAAVQQELRIILLTASSYILSSLRQTMNVEEAVLFELIASLTQLTVYLPFSHSRSIVQDVLDLIKQNPQKKTCVDALVSTINKDPRVYHSLFSALVLSDKKLFQAFLDLALQDTAVLPLLEIVLRADGSQYTSQIPDDSEVVALKIDPFVTISLKTYEDLLETSRKSEVAQCICELLVTRNSTEFGPVTLNTIVKETKKDILLSHTIRLLAALTQSNMVEQNSHILTDVVNNNDVVSKLSTVAINKDTAKEQRALAIQVLHSLVTDKQLKINLTASSIATLSQLPASDKVPSADNLEKTLDSLLKQKHKQSLSKNSISVFATLIESIQLSVPARTLLKLEALVVFIKELPKAKKHLSQALVNQAEKLLEDPEVLKYNTSSVVSQRITENIEQVAALVLDECQMKYIQLLNKLISSGLVNQSSVAKIFTSIIDGDTEFKKKLFDRSIEQQETTALLQLLHSCMTKVDLSTRKTVLQTDKKLLKQLLILYEARTTINDLILYDIFSIYEVSGIDALYNYLYVFGLEQELLLPEVYITQGWSNFKLDEKVFKNTIHAYPTDLPLYTTYGQAQKYFSSDLTMYDPRFLLRWALFSSAAYKSDAGIFSSPVLSLAVRALCSSDLSLRQLAYEVLAWIEVSVRTQVVLNAKSVGQKAPIEHVIVWVFLTQLKRAIGFEPYKIVYSLNSLLFAKIANTLRDPADPAYAKCAKIFTNQKNIHIAGIPVLGQTHLYLIQQTGYDWIMEFLIWGLDDNTKATKYFTHAGFVKPPLEELLTLFDSVTLDIADCQKLQGHIVSLLKNITKFATGIISKNELLLWCRVHLEDPGYSQYHLDIIEILNNIYTLAAAANIGKHSNHLLQEITPLTEILFSDQHKMKPMAWNLIHTMRVFALNYWKEHGLQEVHIQSLFPIQLLPLFQLVTSGLVQLKVALKIVMLSTFNESIQETVAQMLHSSQSAKDTALLLKKSLLEIHSLFDRNVTIDVHTLSSYTWCLATFISGVNSLQNNEVKLLFFGDLLSGSNPASLLLLDLFVRKQLYTISADNFEIVENINISLAILLRHILHTLSDIDLSGIATAMQQVPVRSDLMDVHAFRSNLLNKNSSSSRKVHNSVSIFLRRLYSFVCECRNAMVDDEASVKLQQCIDFLIQQLSQHQQQEEQEEKNSTTTLDKKEKKDKKKKKKNKDKKSEKSKKRKNKDSDGSEQKKKKQKTK